jgi:catechol 2,3-dioxygenase-like lactoylglutathione lyase family enzyme
MSGNATTVAFLPATDLERSSRFLTEVVGLTLVERTPIADVYDSHGTRLRVTLVEQAPSLPFTVLGWEVADIARAVDEASSRGAVFERFEGFGQNERGIWTAPGGDRIAWFRDTEGNLLSFSQHA